MAYRLARLGRQLLAITLSTLLLLQPAIANAQSVSASSTAAPANQPGVGAAPNGVPLIDIVTPNAQGLSHNKYDNFNVGTSGLILNNSNAEVGISNLGGATPGNANLSHSGPASVILNEVTSGNRSALNGATEVFGGRADVIIANPNGITCDGCGFINTPHATLTTGTPDIGSDGRLNGFTVNGGDVTFQGQGGNFASAPGAVDLFDVVSRSIHVNAPVYGKSVRLTAGANAFNYASGEATALTATSGTPEYAIDGSALGAMQADRIKIVVTEKGAGVNMSGAMAANAGELSLSADGKISIGNASGSQGVSIASKSKVTAGHLTSKARLAVHADQGITLQSAAADDAIDLSSGAGLLSVAGDVNSATSVQLSSAAGIAAGSLAAGGAATLSASAGDIRITDTGDGNDSLTVTASAGSITAGRLLSQGAISLTAGLDIGVSGDLLAGGNLTARGRSMAAGMVVAGLDFAATSTEPNGSPILGSTGDLQLTATGGTINGTGFQSAGSMTITAAALQGQSVVSHAAITINGSTDISSQILAASDLSIAGDHINGGAMASGVDFAAMAASASGIVELGNAGDMFLQAAAGGIAAGTLISAGALHATASEDIAANVISHGTLDLNAGGDIRLNGQSLAGADITLTANNIDLGSLISGVDFAATNGLAGGNVVIGASGSMTIDATQGSVTSGDLLSAGDMSVHAGQNVAYASAQSSADIALSAHSGSISLDKITRADGSIALTAQSIDLSAGHSGLGTAGTLTITTTNANFSGSSLTFGGLDIQAGGTVNVDNATIGTTAAFGGSGDMLISAAALVTGASTNLLAEHDLDLTLPALTNSGQVAAGHDLTIDVAGNLNNTATGLLYAGNDADLLVAGTLTNNQGAIIAGNDLTIAGNAAGGRNGALVNTAGLIKAGNDMNIVTSYLLNQRLTTPTVAHGVQVSTNAVSSFRLNPDVAGQPFAHLFDGWNDDDDSQQLYSDLPRQYWDDYKDALWSQTTAPDGTQYRAWTWTSAEGPVWSDAIREWIEERAPRDANGNLVLDPNNPSRYFIVQRQAEADTSTVYTWDAAANLGQSVYEDQFTAPLSPEGTISSGHNVSIDATNLTNSYSSIIAGNDATLSGSVLNNEGVALYRTTTLTCNAEGACTAYNPDGTANPSKNIAAGTSIVTSVAAIGSASSTIKAGRALDVGFGTVNNTAAAGSMAGGAGVAAPGTTADPTAALAGMTAGGALFSLNSAAASLTADPAALRAALASSTPRPQSGGIGGTIPGQVFLFETRATFLDVSKFYGSAYFLDRIGYQPDVTVPFLGDAYYENQLIDQQLRQAVGAGLGGGSIISGADAIEQMKTLLDDGVAYAQAHGLALGQGLTPEQAASLTQSIVLYQTQTVDGIEVLAPVVYLSAADRAKATVAGATLAGGTVDMNVGQLNNSGAIAAAGDMTVKASDIKADGGTFLAGGGLTLTAENGLTLAAQTMPLGGQMMVNPDAGVKAGGDVQLAAKGDMSLAGANVDAGGNAKLSGNNVTLGVAKVTNGGQDNATGTAIKAGGNLDIAAAKDINVIGSSAQSGGDLALTATNGSVDILSAGLSRQTDDGYMKTTGTDTQGSQLIAGGNMSLAGNAGILISGSTLSADGNLGLASNGDINVTTAASQSSSVFGKNSSSSVTQTGSDISAKGNIAAKSGNDLNILGSGIAADGLVDLTAGGDVTIAEATNSSSLDFQASTKGGGLFGSKKKISGHLETTDAVGSSVSGGKGVAITSGGDTVVSASKLSAGDADHPAADLSISAGGNVVIASGKDTDGLTNDGSSHGFLSSGKWHEDRYDETTVGSELSATGNVKVQAGGQTVVSGSKVSADGDLALSGSTVTVMGAQEEHDYDKQKKKSGIGVGSGGGFLSIYGSKDNKNSQSQTDNIGSSLSSGGSTTITSTKGDVNIVGSSVEADEDINLSAARDVNVTPGAESASQSQEEKKSGFGLSFSGGNGGVSIGIGAQTTKDKSAEQSQTNAVSSLKAGRDLNISAGNNVNLQAAQASAERDVDLFAVNDINLLSANDVTNYQEAHEKTFAGVTLTVGSQVGNAAQSIMNSAERLTDSGGVNGITNATIAGLGVYQGLKDLKGAYDQLGSKDGLGFTLDLSLGINHQQSSSSSTVSAPVVTDIRAGRSISIDAEKGSITSDGAQIAAGYDEFGMPTFSGDPLTGDILLSAENGNINLNAATGTSATDSRNSSYSAGVGVGFDCGVKGGCKEAGVTVRGSYGKGGAETDGVTHYNSHVDGTGDVILNADGVAIRGGTVAGNSVTVDANSLTIESQVDTAKAKADQLNVSASVGSDSFNVSGVTQNAKGDAAIVSEQSGIHAGTGGLDISIDGKTSIVGGLITSDATADKNHFETGTLDVTDIDTHSTWKADTYGGSIGSSGLSIAPPVKAGENETGKALSAIGGNIGITITDPAHQVQDIGTIRRDTDNTNTTLPGLPDLQNILREQYKTQADLQAAQATMAGLVGDIASSFYKQAVLNDDQASIDFWKEGGVGRALLHSIGGGLLGGVNGWEGALKGALGGASSTLFAPAIQQLIDGMLKGSTMSAADKAQLAKLLGASLSAVVGGAVGGGEGAAYGAANYQYNYLPHEDLEKALNLARELAKCEGIISNCADYDTLKAEIAEYQKESQKNTADLMAACSQGATDECKKRMLDLQAFNQAVDDEFQKMMENPRGASPASDPSDTEARFYETIDGGLRLDLLAEQQFAAVLQGAQTGEQARENIVAKVIQSTKDLGKLSSILDAAGLIGSGLVLVLSDGTTLPILAGGLGAASSGSHLSGDIQQAITGVVTDPGIVQLLKSGGISPDTALAIQNAIDIGAVVLGVAEGGQQIYRVVRPGLLSSAELQVVEELPTPNTNGAGTGANPTGSAGGETGGSCSGVGCSTGCSFDGSTLVKTLDGFTAISKIQPGKTMVWSRDEQGHEGYKLTLARIREKHTETVYLTVKSIANGQRQTIVTTTNHPFFAVLAEERAVPVSLPEGHIYQGPIKNGSWVPAGDLRSGEKLSDADGSWSSVVNVRVEEQPLDAYNLTVAEFHTYFVKQAANENAEPIWVHNSCIRWSQSDKSWVDSNGDVVGNPTSLVDPQKTQHILYGDSTGGGHMSGADITNAAAIGKSQFPTSWSEEEVIAAISDVVSNPTSVVAQQTGPAGSLVTKAGNPSRFVVTGSFNGVQINVIYEPSGVGVVTAYPIQ